MRNIKKVFMLIGILTISTALLFGCRKEIDLKDNKQETPVTTALTEAVEPSSEPLPTEIVVTDPTTSWSEDMKKMRNISSIELVKEIKIGWNIGNTLDANGSSGLETETSWGNPKITKELVDVVKVAGFNVVRIPTTWQPHIGPAPDYIIDTAWMDRVQEVVNYCIADDMFVILNAHHDDWYSPYYDNADTAKDMMAKVWKQIADRFENYDEHLIFESMNEPRQIGTDDEWNGGNSEGWDVVNQLNTVFVDTIRNAGGNNPLRHLMIPPYAATGATIAWETFDVPKDDKIIVSIHAYTPYDFTLNESGTDNWSSINPLDTYEINKLMNNLEKRFISKGIPVIIGEFGSINKNNNTADRVDWVKYYVKKASKIGVPCIWWDNGSIYGRGDLFGLLDRLNDNWQFPEINDAMMEGLQ